MIGDAAALEERLLHGYRAQLDRYDLAAEILEQQRNHDGRHWAHALHAHLLEAAALDAAMAQDKAAWREWGRTAAGPLKDVLDRLGERIRSLSEVIDRQIGAMRAGQQGLTSEIDEFIQKRRMLQAYVKHG